MAAMGMLPASDRRTNGDLSAPLRRIPTQYEIGPGVPTMSGYVEAQLGSDASLPFPLIVANGKVLAIRSRF